MRSVSKWTIAALTESEERMSTAGPLEQIDREFDAPEERNRGSALSLVVYHGFLKESEGGTEACSILMTVEIVIEGNAGPLNSSSGSMTILGP